MSLLLPGQYGKFSMLWKTFFHSVENFLLFFPWRGKPGPDFSTVWKTFFHAVENPPVRLPSPSMLATINGSAAGRPSVKTRMALAAGLR